MRQIGHTALIALGPCSHTRAFHVPPPVCRTEHRPRQPRGCADVWLRSASHCTAGS